MCTGQLYNTVSMSIVLTEDCPTLEKKLQKLLVWRNFRETRTWSFISQKSENNQKLYYFKMIPTDATGIRDKDSIISKPCTSSQTQTTRSRRTKSHQTSNLHPLSWHNYTMWNHCAVRQVQFGFVLKFDSRSPQPLICCLWGSSLQLLMFQRFMPKEG